MKKIGAAVQLNHTKDEELFEYQMSFRELGLEPIFFGIIPFTTETTGTEPFADYNKVICIGSVKIIDLWSKGFLPKEAAVFYDEEKFDQLFYSCYFPKELLLNGGATYGKFGIMKDRPMSVDSFVKPSKDLKAFAGMVIEAGRTIAEEVFSRQVSSSFSENPDDEVVLVAPLKNIKKEYRNFVVDGKIVDSSIYKIGSKITYEVPTKEEREEIQAFFDVIKGYYEPHDNYVVDFAMLEDGTWNLIEYNCFNCAGMYATDRRKIFKAVMEYLNK